MAIASPSAPSFSASLCCTRTDSASRLSEFKPRLPARLHRRLALACQLDPFASPVPPSPDDDLDYELQHSAPPSARRHRRLGSAVYVALPADAVEAGAMKRKKVMTSSFRALAAAGVEGIVMEVWWGVVEREAPRVYDWEVYLEIAELAQRCGLKVRAVLAFHQRGVGPDDPLWIPLPQWVREQMDNDPDLAHSDRFGRRNAEYISVGCDVLPVLRGRSPIQAYSEFMSSFRDMFRQFLGGVITGIQVGMGPSGELRYPPTASQRLTWTWRSHELGEFQCYDKYMLASLNACAEDIGKREWGNGGPIGTGSLMHDPETTDFFKRNGSWDTPYGEFFLAWYSRMLLLHGERICKEAATIFRGLEVNLSGKLAGVYWHYFTWSHPAELTAGYYNTSVRDGLLPIARMFGRYGFSLCCTCFEIQDAEERRLNPVSSPEGFVRQLSLAARTCGIPLQGENYADRMDDESFEQVLRTSRFYWDGLGTPDFSFNLVRMDKNLFEYRSWLRFTHFVRQMAEAKVFRSKRGSGEGDIPLSSLSVAANARALFVC